MFPLCSKLGEIYIVLPDTNIHLKEEPNRFLKRMCTVAAQCEAVESTEKGDLTLDEGLLGIKVEYKGATSHQDLGGMFIWHEKDPNVIRCEMVAFSWDGDDARPSKETYMKAAKLVLGGLLRKYNSEFKTSYRLAFSNPRYGPKPSKLTLQLLDRFCVLANTSSLHPLDWRRFYEFVRRHRQILPEETVSYLLQKRGFTRRYAEDIASVYTHLTEYKVQQAR